MLLPGGTPISFFFFPYAHSAYEEVLLLRGHKLGFNCSPRELPSVSLLPPITTFSGPQKNLSFSVFKITCHLDKGTKRTLLDEGRQAVTPKVEVREREINAFSFLWIFSGFISRSHVFSSRFILYSRSRDPHKKEANQIEMLFSFFDARDHLGERKLVQFGCH